MYGEMRINQGKRLFGIILGILLLTAFALAQPMSYAQVENEGITEGITAEGIPAFQNCDDQFLVDVSMDTVRSKNVILTTHSEKEIFECFTVQGNIEVLIEVTIVAQIYENVTTKDIIRKQVEVINCIRDPSQAKTYGCEVDTPDTTVTPVRNCVADEIRKNQNSISKGSLVKTIEAQKMVYLCDLDGFDRDENGQPIRCENNLHDTQIACFDPEKKVDEVIFAETWKNLNELPNDPIIKTTFESLRCVVLLSDAEVESCIFTSLGGS